MKRLLHFEKWEGLGNDFILVDTKDAPTFVTAELSRALCDRHRGIGADGVLVLGHDGDEPRMVVWNADGSRPEMCGNGLRCVAAFEAEGRGRDDVTIDFATDAGRKRCVITRVNENLYDVTVDMGQAKMGAPLEVHVAKEKRFFTTVDVGNPHAITFEPYERAEMDAFAPIVERAPVGGTNVEFCRLVEGAARPVIEVIVWERGVGYTLACGTGACAVAAAACEAARAPFGLPIDVVLPGGALSVTVDETWGLRMRGPARRVYRGEVTI